MSAEELAKMSLALLRENLYHFESFGFFQEPVEINETAAQLARQVAPDSALSDRHETNECDVLDRRFRQRTSSS